MTITIITPLTPYWQHVHADWWQDAQGNDIHRVEIDGDALYHCHLAGSSLPWNAVATSLTEAMAVCNRRAGDPDSRRRSTPGHVAQEMAWEV
ncbi:hypothetical protein QLQ85_07940 [Halomonas sp. M4R5S39]|uniref:hypothetical protein n=1 Tax=Halomonas kalidii TaxID=3043293 RepID=UPI0024A8CC52|nr:hypothetical protein [Halomonas kalidii]MDI5984719.1 hypothetical protein [Halomonas kalidii]